MVLIIRALALNIVLQAIASRQTKSVLLFFALKASHALPGPHVVRHSLEQQGGLLCSTERESRVAASPDLQVLTYSYNIAMLNGGEIQ